VSRNLKTYCFWLVNSSIVYDNVTGYNGKIVAMENVADGVFGYL